MAVKERSQIKGTDAQIKAFAGHNGVLAFATDTKSLHVLSGTAGTTTEFLPSTKVATKTELGGIESALENKLSLTGGTVTGDLNVNGSLDTSTINGSRTSSLTLHYGRGAWLSLSGDQKHSVPGEEGMFKLIAATYNNDGNDGWHNLTGRANNGSLQWDGREVERLVGSIFPQGVENVGDEPISGYIRYDTGLQICYGVARTTSAGQTITFPVPFLKVPCVFASRASALVLTGVAVSADTATTTTISICQSTAANWAVSWLAIGVWK